MGNLQHILNCLKVSVVILDNILSAFDSGLSYSTVVLYIGIIMVLGDSGTKLLLRSQLKTA